MIRNSVLRRFSARIPKNRNSIAESRISLVVPEGQHTDLLIRRRKAPLFFSDDKQNGRRWSPSICIGRSGLLLSCSPLESAANSVPDIFAKVTNIVFLTAVLLDLRT
jgi:hypothetical protein